MTMAILAVALLLATPSSATLFSAEAIGENSEPHTIQLRGRTSSSSIRSLSDVATAETNRFEQDRRPTRDSVFLPVSPGIAEGVDPENLPCLVETICEQPELSILCGFTTANLREWKNNKNNNFFVGEGEGIFFAPINGAFQDSSRFSLMSNVLSTDLANATILENVLSYHALPIDINASSNNATYDLLFALEDFECDEELMMANGQTTNTQCFGELDKVLMGDGNRPMRTLPRIIEEGIEACDGTVVLHFVDQLILPSLPLVGMEVPPLTEPLPEPSSLECPVDQPRSFDTSCSGYAGGKTCDYGHMYLGCTWDTLYCGLTASCSCDEASETWACMMAGVASCGTFDADVGDWVDNTPKGLPWGEFCDPDEELPTPPPALPEPSSLECPVDQPGSFDASCSGYPEGQMCNYGHMYMGCTWDTLQCGWTASCSCDEASETWACMMAGVARCGTFDADVGDWVDNTPEGLPWGEFCDPDEELPTPPPECPVDLPGSFDASCSGYPEGQMCNYGHMYMGCTWDTLQCGWTASCSCDEASETWACMTVRVAGCGTSAPEGLPWGELCDPEEELPPPPTTTREEDSVEGRLSDECPPSADFGSCSGYEPDLPCDYDYAYTGCTWETLECLPIMQCQCNTFENGNWACRTESRLGCSDKLEGHPGGLRCDPNDPLPLPLLPSTPVTSRNEEHDQKVVVAEMMGGAMP